MHLRIQIAMAALWLVAGLYYLYGPDPNFAMAGAAGALLLFNLVRIAVLWRRRPPKPPPPGTQPPVRHPEFRVDEE